jgi:tetraacyldisaccharide 4'-kinase
MPTPNILLSPLSLLYGAATRARLALYRAGGIKTTRVPVPVISVGNITTGGTGKTPLVAWVARQLADMDQRVCILTRGYGRENEAEQVVVSDGVRVLAGAREGGDEPRLLAEMLEGKAAVISNSNRVAAARWAIETLQSTVFVLDDGFQHLALARELDLLVIDATNPWGGGRLLPGGRLREPLSGLARADAIVITRSELAADVDALNEEAKRLSSGRPVFIATTKQTRLRPLDSREIANSVNIPQPVAAFCGIGNPQAFFAQLRNNHSVAHTKSFRDHHTYTQSDIDAFVADARGNKAQSIVTTAKDAVKLVGLKFEIPCYVSEIDLSFDNEQELIGMLRNVVELRRPQQG